MPRIGQDDVKEFPDASFNNSFCGTGQWDLVGSKVQEYERTIGCSMWLSLLRSCRPLAVGVHEFFVRTDKGHRK